MRFLDRLTGGKLSHLPDAFLPGRYCLLEPLVVNGHSHLQAGDLVLIPVLPLTEAQQQVAQDNLPPWKRST